MTFIDFNLQIYYGHFSFIKMKGVANEYRKNNFCSTYGIPSHVRVSQVCSKISWQLQNKKFFLSGPISLHGLCSIDLSRKSPRHRSMSAFSKNKTISHGHSRKSLSQYLGRCKRKQKLANIYIMRIMSLLKSILF